MQRLVALLFASSVAFAACGSPDSRLPPAPEGGAGGGGGGGAAGRGGTGGRGGAAGSAAGGGAGMVAGGSAGSAAGGTAGSGSGGSSGSGGPGGAGGRGGTAGSSAIPDGGPPPVDAPVDMAPPIDLALPLDSPAPDLRVDTRLPPDMAPPPPQDTAPPLAAGAVGQWELDEASGTRAADTTANGNHGALMEYATPTWSAGRRTNALSFDGTQNWVKVARSSTIDGITNALTIAAWANRSADVGGYSVILSRQSGTSGSEHYALNFNANRPELIIASNQSGTHKCAAPNLAPTNQWLHVAGTWDGSLARLYVNGTEVCSFARTITLPSDTTPVVIGGNANNSSDDAQELFRGLLDDVMLFSRALSAAEIANLAK